MDFKLYFCTDGILRAQFSEKQPMIPLKFLQEKSPFKDNDLRFWTRWWESNTYFEEGLTVNKFLFCLEPWAGFWTDITHKDIQLYVQEARKPCIVKDTEKDPLDWIELSYHTEVEPETEYQRDDDNLFERDLNAWFNSPKEMRLTGQWNIHSAYKLTGYKIGQVEQYGVDHCPINEIGNLPLVLSNKQIVYFTSWSAARVLGKAKADIFKKDAFGVSSIPHMKFVKGEKHHNIRDVVEGFFWWFSSTPAKRDAFMEELMSIKDDIDADISEQEAQEETNNVVALFPNEHNDSESENPKQEDSGEKKMKIKVADGAFSSIISRYERDKDYWEDMLEAAKEGEVILKIGQTISQASLENRIFSHILKEDDAKENPQPSEYKKI